VPHASAVSLAATHIAGVADVEAGCTVTERLNRRLALSNCTRGSVRLSVLRSSRLSVTPPLHSTVPVFVVTWMNVLTSSTISVPLVAAFGSGGWQPPQPVAWLMPSKLLLTGGARVVAARVPGRRPVVGRDGRSVAGRRWDTGGGVLASGDLAAWPRLTVDAVAVPPPDAGTAADAGPATAVRAAVASSPTAAVARSLFMCRSVTADPETDLAPA
jgi:hypothetical protein